MPAKSDFSYTIPNDMPWEYHVDCVGGLIRAVNERGVLVKDSLERDAREIYVPKLDIYLRAMPEIGMMGTEPKTDLVIVDVKLERKYFICHEGRLFSSRPLQIKTTTMEEFFSNTKTGIPKSQIKKVKKIVKECIHMGIYKESESPCEGTILPIKAGCC